MNTRLTLLLSISLALSYSTFGQSSSDTSFVDSLKSRYKLNEEFEIDSFNIIKSQGVVYFKLHLSPLNFHKELLFQISDGDTLCYLENLVLLHMLDYYRRDFIESPMFDSKKLLRKLHNVKRVRFNQDGITGYYKDKILGIKKVPFDIGLTLVTHSGNSFNWYSSSKLVNYRFAHSELSSLIGLNNINLFLTFSTPFLINEDYNIEQSRRAYFSIFEQRIQADNVISVPNNEIKSFW